MTRDDMLELVGRWQQAFASRDLDAYAASYSPTADFHSPMAGSVSGPGGALKVFEAFFSAFPDAVVASEPAIVDGDRVAIAAEVSGTHVGSLLGLPPTGKPFRFTIVFLLEIRDGLIVRERRIYDFTGLLIQVGVLKAKPAQ